MKFKREAGDDKPIFSKLGPLNFPDFIACCMNSIIGTGALRLGSAFNSGILFTHIFNIFVALVSLYSIKLYILSAARYHESTFEEIWSAAFSRSTVIIPAFASIVSSIANVMSYINFLENSVVTIVKMIIKLAMNDGDEIIEKVERFVVLIGLLIVIVFCIPICMITNLKSIVIMSYISLSSFLFIFLYIIIRFIIITVNDGFDPGHRFKLFDFNYISGSVSSLTFAYLFYPFAWPGIRHSNNPCLNNLSKIFYTTIGIVYIIYTITGTFSYLTFFDLNTGGIILEYYSDKTTADQILLIIGHIMTFLFILFTIPIVMNSSRYILLNALHKKDEFPKDVWTPVGITLTMISFVLANVTGKLSDVIYIASDLLTLIQLFFFPPIFFLRGYGYSKKLHFYGAIFELIIGIAAMAFMIYADCFE